MPIPMEPPQAELTLAGVCGALCDPIRLALVAELNRRGEVRCNDFHVVAAKSTLSHHFKVLREAGLTRTRVEGTMRFIRLRKACLDRRFPGVMDALLASLDPSDAETTMDWLDAAPHEA